MLLLFQSLGCATIIVKLSWKCKVCKIDPGEEVTTKPKRCHFHPSPFLSKIKTLFCILSLHCIRMNSWFANPDHKLLLCHMGKHGSTTWARFGWYCAFLILCFFLFIFQLLLLHVHWTKARGPWSFHADKSQEVKF